MKILGEYKCQYLAECLISWVLSSSRKLFMYFFLLLDDMPILSLLSK